MINAVKPFVTRKDVCHYNIIICCSLVRYGTVRYGTVRYGTVLRTEEEKYGRFWYNMNFWVILQLPLSSIFTRVDPKSAKKILMMGSEYVISLRKYVGEI